MIPCYIEVHFISLKKRVHFMVFMTVSVLLVGWKWLFFLDNICFRAHINHNHSSNAHKKKHKADRKVERGVSSLTISLAEKWPFLNFWIYTQYSVKGPDKLWSTISYSEVELDLIFLSVNDSTKLDEIQSLISLMEINICERCRTKRLRLGKISLVLFNFVVQFS